MVSLPLLKIAAKILDPAQVRSGSTISKLDHALQDGRQTPAIFIPLKFWSVEARGKLQRKGRETRAGHSAGESFE